MPASMTNPNPNPTCHAMGVITRMREARHLTSSDMTDALTRQGYAITFHQYRAAEDGRTQRVSFDLIAHAAHILDIVPADLFTNPADGHTAPPPDHDYPSWDDLCEAGRQHWQFTVKEVPPSYMILRTRGTLDEYISNQDREHYAMAQRQNPHRSRWEDLDIDDQQELIAQGIDQEEYERS